MSNNKLSLGIDGGGTKNHFVLWSEEKGLLLEGITGPANYQQTELFFKSMQEMIFKLDKYLKKYQDPVQLAVCAGFAGVVGVPGAAENIDTFFRERFAEIMVNLVQCRVVSDAVMVLDTYFYERPGVILISGTGSICLGRDKKQRVFRAGGFGHLIDDIGSGYYFGKMAIKIALESNHHFKAYSPLEELIKEHYKIDYIDDVVNLVYQDSGKAVTASASPLLFKAAESGCKFSRKAVMEGIKGLIILVKNCRKAIKDKHADLILHGTVFQQKILLDELRKKLPNMKIETGNRNVALSAAELAWK